MINKSLDCIKLYVTVIFRSIRVKALKYVLITQKIILNKLKKST